MKYVTLDELEQRRDELAAAKEKRLADLAKQYELTAAGFDNAIALADELIEKATTRDEIEDSDG